MRPLLLLLALLCFTGAFAQEVNLALPTNGGIPSALSSAPNLAYSAGKACDDKPDTGWVAGTDMDPVWLRVEWRFPVEVRGVALQSWANCPVADATLPGPVTVEYLREDQWQALSSVQAGSSAPGVQMRVTMEQPVTTEAVRVLLTGTGKPVAISEFQVFGPKPELPLALAPTWQASYIWGEPSLYIAQRQPIRRYFRRSFTLDDPAQVREAWLLTCAYDRLNAFWVNNREVARDMSYNGELMREPLRVKLAPTDLLKGENVLAASVDDLYEVGGRGLLAELVLVKTDGTRLRIGTDSQWQAQEDQGVTPDWRKPGLTDKRWVPASVVSGPNGRWQWLWSIPYPVVAPDESLKVTALTFTPAQPKPGTTATCQVTFQTTAKLTRDYAVILRLGQYSLVRDHDYELWGAALKPEQVKTSAWEPGTHTVSIPVRIPPETPRDCPATLLVSLPDAGAGLTTDLPGCEADAYGLHLTVPVDRGPATATLKAGAFPGAEIKDCGGAPTLHLAGRPVAPIIWTSAYGNYRRYSQYPTSGVNIIRPLIEGGAVPAPGEEEAYDKFWFAQVDTMLLAALRVNPDLWLLPALWMDANPQVLFDEPSEQMISGRGQQVIKLSHQVPDRGTVRPTFMSEDWRRRGAESMKRLVAHMRTQPYASRLIGFIFFAGRAGENYWGGNELNLFLNEQGNYDAKPRAQWDVGDFSMAARRTFREFLLRKYQTDAALQQAWQRTDLRIDDVLEPSRFRKEEICDLLVWTPKPAGAGTLRDPLTPGVGTLPMDYFQCYSEAMVDTFDAWGRAVKEASGNKLVTGCYQGYTLAQLFTSVPGFGGHTAVTRAMQTRGLDMFVSPAEYDDDRRAGGHFWGHNITDSLRLHNKLWIYEQDSRTFLADIPPKTYSQRETVEVFKRDCAASLTHGNGWWWYEFSTGQYGPASKEWFDDPAILDFAGQMKRVYDYSLTLPDRSPSSQVAVFYHGETHTAQDLFPPSLALNISLGRLTLLEGLENFGAPFDLYNLADLPVLQKSGKLDQYKLCLFLNPFYLTATERGWLDLAKGGGRTLVWLYAPGLAQVGKPLSPEHVAEVTGIAGVKWLRQEAEPTCRLVASGSPLLQGLPEGYELAPRPFFPGSFWERFGNKISPLLYVDPKATQPDTQVLGDWVLDGKLRADLGAFCVRKINEKGQNWTSVYSAVPYLSRELLRNLAHAAGVHVYRESNDILFADRYFVAIHTGKTPATDTLKLPRPTPVYDVFGKKLVSPGTDSVKLTVPAYSTVLYYLGDPAKFKAAVE